MNQYGAALDSNPSPYGAPTPAPTGVRKALTGVGEATQSSVETAKEGFTALGGAVGRGASATKEGLTSLGKFVQGLAPSDGASAAQP